MKTIETKCDVIWDYVMFILLQLHNYPPLFRDLKFMRLLSNLEAYVDKKIGTLKGGDIIDSYLVVVQEAIDNVATTQQNGEKI